MIFYGFFGLKNLCCAHAALPIEAMRKRNSQLSDRHLQKSGCPGGHGLRRSTFLVAGHDQARINALTPRFRGRQFASSASPEN
jgi:hypothetical protein